jgi:hypothetical protein
MALTAADVLGDPELLAALKAAFATR